MALVGSFSVASTGFLFRVDRLIVRCRYDLARQAPRRSSETPEQLFSELDRRLLSVLSRIQNQLKIRYIYLTLPPPGLWPISSRYSSGSKYSIFCLSDFYAMLDPLRSTHTLYTFAYMRETGKLSLYDYSIWQRTYRKHSRYTVGFLY
jgi:hypothetical protein